MCALYAYRLEINTLQPTGNNYNLIICDADHIMTFHKIN